MWKWYNNSTYPSSDFENLRNFTIRRLKTGATLTLPKWATSQNLRYLLSDDRYDMIFFNLIDVNKNRIFVREKMGVSFPSSNLRIKAPSTANWVTDRLKLDPQQIVGRVITLPECRRHAAVFPVAMVTVWHNSRRVAPCMMNGYLSRGNRNDAMAIAQK